MTERTAMTRALRMSIGVNLLLLAFIGGLLLRPNRSRPSGSAVWAPQSAPVTQSGRPETISTARPPDVKRNEPLLNHKMVAEIEQLGISREAVANVLLEDFERRWAGRLAELRDRFAPKPVPQRESVAFFRTRDAAQASELKEALGDDGYAAWDKEQTLAELNGARLPGDNLPMAPEEADRAYALQKRFDERKRELRWAEEDGVVDAADAGALLAQAQQSLDSDLKKLLGKPRFDELRSNGNDGR